MWQGWWCEGIVRESRWVVALMGKMTLMEMRDKKCENGDRGCIYAQQCTGNLRWGCSIVWSIVVPSLSHINLLMNMFFYLGQTSTR